jgi:drug/metabolite transporter (DMT)-like permease
MLISLLEIVLGPLGVWLVFSQQPGVTTLVGGAIVLAAVGVHLLGSAHPGRAGVVAVAIEP